MEEALGRDFILGPEIGSGRFGVVRSCRSLATGEFYAVKSIDLTAITDPIDLDSTENEAKFTSLVSGHPNVIHLHAFYSSSTSLHLVLDLCSGPTLHDRITKFPPPTEKQVISLFHPLMEAIGHCHRRGVVHRDVKPENILFDSNGRLRLADFGSAGDGRTKKMEGLFGTPYYVAPEVVAGNEYDEKVDVWSAGVILYVMLAGILPFDGESVVEVFEKVMRGNLRFPTRVWKGVSPAAKDLVRKMLSRDVGRRLSADQVLRHPWMLKDSEEDDDDESFGIFE